MFRRTHFVAFLLAVGSVIATFAEAAAPAITSAIPNASGNQLTINGSNLCCGTTSVMLGSSGPLAIVTQSATQLVVTLPTPALASGDYTLIVKVGPGAGGAVESVVTIGAAGPQGPQGPQGATGPQGPAGTDGSQFSCGSVISNLGPSCQNPDGLGLIHWGHVTTLAGSLPANGSSSHWYAVSFESVVAAGEYKPTIYFTQGADEYVFDVYYDCNTRVRCFNPGGVDSFGTEYFDADGNGNPDSSCVQPGSTVYIRVRPLTSNPQCGSYRLNFQDG